MAMTLALPVVGFWSVAQSAPIEDSRPPATETVIVEPGDTLWGYATALTEPGGDVRNAVDEIKALNHLPTADIQVGQKLHLPTTRG